MVVDKHIPVVKIYALSSPRVEFSGEIIHLKTRKSLALLIYLAVSDKTQSRDSIITLLWPELDPSRARAGLRRELSTLKKALPEGCILADRQCIALGSKTSVWLDIKLFRSALQSQREHDHPEEQGCQECIDHLKEAAKLYRGEFLEGFSLPDSPNFDEWQFFQAESLRQDLSMALENLVSALQAVGDFKEAIPYTRRWLSLDNLHEPAQRSLIRLYVWSGQRAAALRQYETCARILKDQLGVTPEKETTQLYREIKAKRTPTPPQKLGAPTSPGKATVLSQRYHLGSELGRGGTSVVYQAHDALLKREVAVKVLTPGTLGGEGSTRMLDEARAAATLNHPNIVIVYDAGESDGLAYIVMEKVPGTALATHKPVSFEEIIEIARGVCQALAYAHEHGIIHRDLKPENILCTPDGKVKLGDFGLARSIASRVTNSGAIIGTTFYLAPELALGVDFDGRADLYALGVVLYEMTTGQLPFSGDDQLAVISQHIHAPLVPPRVRVHQIPPALDDLIIRLLHKDPEDRPACASDVVENLASIDLMEAAPDERPVSRTLAGISRGRLVGREGEMSKARSLWNRTLTGQGQMILISGEAGIGKTRLVQELVTQVKVTGGRVLQGACYAEGGLPYAPFVQVLRRLFESEAVESIDLPEFVIADLITLTPAIRLSYPEIKPEPSLEDPIAQQGRLFENIVIFLAALSDRSPVLLVLEDIHWADSGTLALLRHLARHTRHRRVMIAVTNRDLQPEQLHLLHETLLDLNRERLVIQIRLERLDQEETRQLLELIFTQEITPELEQGIYTETDGNPFYIEEVCKALIESGKMYFQDGQWQRPSITELGIPNSVRVAIQSRIMALPSITQEILLQAAVLGRAFEFDILVATGIHKQLNIIEALDNAERAQIIEEIYPSGGGTFSFVHSLIPSTLVESARSLQRRRLHQQAAAAIKSLRPNDFEALVYHYDHAGDAENAAIYLLQAGDRARALYLHQEAIEHYQRAVDFYYQGIGNIENAARTLMKLGLTYHNAFDFKAARQAYQEGFVLWQRASETQHSGKLPAPPHTLRVTTFQPTNLGPGIAMDLPSGILMDQLFSGLVEVSREMNVVPDVARSWEVFEGGRKYVFHLREDVFWSDGVPVTAHDFTFAMKRVLDPDRRWLPASMLYDIQGAEAYHNGDLEKIESLGIRAVDDHTLVVQLEGPTSYFPFVVGFSPMFPIPQHVVEAHDEDWAAPENIVTNGPFLLKEWQWGSRIILERNPQYHGRFTGNLASVELSFYSRHTHFLDLYRQDQLDVCGSLTPAEWARARQRHPEEYITGSWLSIDFAGFDNSRPPFNDRRVRRAFTMACDREMLADLHLQGFAYPATGGLVPLGMPGHSPEIGLPYDPQAARNLLAQAGYPDGKGFPTLDCIVRDDLGHDIMSEQLQIQWLENLGIDIRWQMVQWKDFPARMQAQYPHIYLTGYWADYPDPDDMLRVLWWMPLGWQNKAYKHLVETAQRAIDQEERLAMYQQADQILIEEAPLLPLCYGRFHMLVKPWVKKYFANPFKWWFFKDVVLEAH